MVSRERRHNPGGWLRFVSLALFACVVVSGCRHRRSALRPVYLDPGSAYYSAPAEAVVPDSTIVVGPDARDQSSGGLPEPSDQGDFITSPSSPITVSPPASPAPDAEPELEPAPRDNATIPSRVGDQPTISPPQSFRTPAPPASTRLTSGASIRELVQERADDPLDLVQPPKADRSWRYIAIHHSGAEKGGYAQLDRQHRSTSGLNGCGYHFVIGNGTESADGTIEVTRRWSEQKPSQHCRDSTDPTVNDYGIAICLVGDFENQQPTVRQLESARLLVQYLQSKYGISAQKVGTHADLSGGKTGSPPCPGRNLDLDDIVGRPALSRR